MQTSETSPPDLEVHEPSWVNETEATTRDPATHTPIARAAKREYIPYLIFALSVSFYFLPFMRILLPGDGDEGLLVSGAVRIVHGQVFARDFFEVVGPGTMYWLALFLKLFGVTFVATRISLFAMSLATALAMYFLSRRVCSRYQVLPIILLVGTYFGSSWPAVSHHVDSNCFALLAVACVIVWLDKRKAVLLSLAGALAGATTCCFQPKGILLLFALLVWLWVQHRRKSASLSWLWAVAGGYVSVVALMLAYFWSRHALWDLFYVNVLWPSQHYSAVNVVPYAQGIIHYYWDHFHIAKAGFRWTIVIASILIAPFLLVAALPALLPALAARSLRNRIPSEVVLYWLCGSALWLSEFHRKDICHLVFGSPLLMILCVYYLQQYRAKVADLALQILAISATCLAAFNLFLVLSARPVATRVGSVALLKSDPVLTLLQSTAAPGEEIFAYPYCAMYYFLSATLNPTRYAAIMYDFNTPSQFEEVVTVLDQRRVRYVVWNKGFEKNAKTFFPGMKKLRDDELIIEPYLKSHYKVVWADTETQLMERNDEAHAN
jgi:4-amino-4-deoxy-L-arabinose transferase-like glycosyltransferase